MMSQSLLKQIPESGEPDYSSIITEDDTPVDNLFSEKQRRLLTEPLNSSWKPGRLFLAASDVGVFYDLKKPPVVPDMFLSLDVRAADDIWEKKNRSYFLREFGKPPEIAVEIVSNTEGGETTKKFGIYAQAGIRYYIIFDPQCVIQKDVLRTYELSGNAYIPNLGRYLPQAGLGPRLWKGIFEGRYDLWLRWCDREGRLIPTGAERADAEYRRAETEYLRAETEQRRAETEYLRAEKLAEKLRSLGIDPDEMTYC